VKVAHDDFPIEAGKTRVFAKKKCQSEKKDCHVLKAQNNDINLKQYLSGG